MGTHVFTLDWSLTTDSVDATRALGTKIGSLAIPGTMILLTGDLGSGKTAIAQGIAAGLSIAMNTVNSPTFTILKEHREGRVPLYHFDLYRIDTASELYDLGFDEYFAGSGMCVIEWAERVPEIWSDDCLWIAFTTVAQTSRLLQLRARGPIAEMLLHALIKQERG